MTNWIEDDIGLLPSKIPDTLPDWVEDDLGILGTFEPEKPSFVKKPSAMDIVGAGIPPLQIPKMFEAGARYPKALFQNLEKIQKKEKDFSTPLRSAIPPLQIKNLLEGVFDPYMHEKDPRSTVQISQDIGKRFYETVGWTSEHLDPSKYGKDPMGRARYAALFFEEYIKYLPFTIAGVKAEWTLNPAMFATFAGLGKVLKLPEVAKFAGKEFKGPPWFESLIKQTIKTFHAPLTKTVKEVQDIRVNKIAEEIHAKMKKNPLLYQEIAKRYAMSEGRMPTENDLKGLIIKELISKGIYEYDIKKLSNILKNAKKWEVQGQKPEVSPSPQVGMKRVKPSVPTQFTNPNDPEMLDYLARYFQPKDVARLPPSERLRLANLAWDMLRDAAYGGLPSAQPEAPKSDWVEDDIGILEKPLTGVEAPKSDWVEDDIGILEKPLPNKKPKLEHEAIVNDLIDLIQSTDKPILAGEEGDQGRLWLSSGHLKEVQEVGGPQAALKVLLKYLEGKKLETRGKDNQQKKFDLLLEAAKRVGKASGLAAQKGKAVEGWGDEEEEVFQPTPKGKALSKEAAKEAEVVIPVELLGAKGYGKFLEKYKGRYIVEMDNGEIAVWNPAKKTFFRVSLDDSTMQHKMVPGANTVKSARDYIDWVTGIESKPTPTEGKVDQLIQEAKKYKSAEEWVGKEFDKEGFREVEKGEVLPRGYSYKIDLGGKAKTTAPVRLKKQIELEREWEAAQGKKVAKTPKAHATPTEGKVAEGGEVDRGFMPGEPFEVRGNAASFETEDGKWYIQREDGTKVLNPKTGNALFENTDDAWEEYNKPSPTEGKAIDYQLDVLSENAIRGEGADPGDVETAVKMTKKQNPNLSEVENAFWMNLDKVVSGETPTEGKK